MKQIQIKLEEFNEGIQLRRAQAAAITPMTASSEALDERRAKILKERLAKQGVVNPEVPAEEAIINDLLKNK